MGATAMAFDPDVLHIYCRTCHGALSVQCGPQGAHAGPATCRCPYCREQQTSEFGAPVLWIVKGHDDVPDA